MIGTILTFSSTSWFGAWIGLEINLLSFIPLMINNKNILSSEAALKYFLTQALASAILLIRVILFYIIYQISDFYLLKYANILISSSLLIKRGAAPFHFWFPRVIEGLTWINSLLLITWQKLAPLILFSYTLNDSFFLFAVVIFCIFFGAIGGLNQTSLRKLMAFSSINHLGWIIIRIIVNENIWLNYFFFYSFLSLTIIFLFNNFKIFNINQIFYLFFNNANLKLLIFLNFLSLGGLPPFLGFFPKWMVIEALVSINLYFILFLIVSFTLITLFFYIRICYSAFILNNFENKWNNFNLIHPKKFNILLNLSFISICGLIPITLFFLLI